MSLPFRHAALQVDDLRNRLLQLDHVRRADPERFVALGLSAESGRCVCDLRRWLLSVRAGIDDLLAGLEEPAVAQGDPLPEKSAGHVSESVHC